MVHFDVGDYRFICHFPLKSNAFGAIFKWLSSQNEMHEDQTARQKIASKPHTHFACNESQNHMLARVFVQHVFEQDDFASERK